MRTTKYERKQKWLAMLVLLTFVFTSILPTNLVSWDSKAEAAVGTLTYTKTTSIENGKNYVIVYNDKYMLKWNGDSYVAQNVTVNKNKLTITDQEQNNILWTITTENNGKIVNKGNTDVKLSVNNNQLVSNGNRNLVVNNDANANTIRTDGGGSNRYYLYYSSGWKVSSSSNNSFSFYYYDAASDSTATVMDTLLYADDVAGSDDYPAYPNQGAVRIHKSATNTSDMTFNSTGVTKVELTATGVSLKKGVDVVVLLDLSTSMEENDRFGKAKAAAEDFVNKIFADNEDGSKSNNRVALVTFAGYSGANNGTDIYGENGYGNDMIFSLKNANAKANIISGIQNLSETYSGTDYTYPFEKANAIFAAAKKQAEDAGQTYNRAQYIVFLTDGAPSKYNNALWKSSNTNTITSEANGKKLTGAETAKTNGVKVYSIGFDIGSSNGFTVDNAKAILKKISSGADAGYYIEATSSTDSSLTEAFDKIAVDIKKAGTNAVVTDIVGDKFVLQMQQNFTVQQTIGGTKDIALPIAPTIEVALYDLYTRADYDNGVITDFNKIGERKGSKTVVETVRFNANGTAAYSSLKGNNVNILVNNQIKAEKFTYDFATKTFTWNLGDITEKEASISYYAYMNGAIEGDREIGSYSTNKSAVLNYTNYLEHSASQIYEQPTKAWGGAAVHYEYYLVNDKGQPINPDGEVVPFANRVRYGEPQTVSFKWNNMAEVDVTLDVNDFELLEGYDLHIKDTKYKVHAVSEGTGAYHTITETVPTTPPQLGAGENGSSTYVYQYDEHRADTYVAFGICKLEDVTTTIHKVDETGQPIVGAQFTVKDAQGNPIAVTTAANGSDFTFEAVYNKNYTITETVAPTGYNGVTESFTVRLNSRTGKLEFMDAAPAGVTLTTGANGAIAITVANTPKLIDLKAVKEWNDNNNQDGIRPDSITLKLQVKQSGSWRDVADKTVTVSSNQHEYVFSGLPGYANGKELEYRVVETNVAAGYTASGGEKDAANGNYIITNTHVPETITISGTKTWDDANNQDGKRPSSIIIWLVADGVKLSSRLVNEASKWKWEFANVPKYKNFGQEIRYTIEEESVAGYTTTINGYDVTNSHTPETIDISGSKTWNDANNQDGKRPASITVYLKANGKTVQTKTVSANDKWMYHFDDLPKYENGRVITYTVSEEAVAGYSNSVNGYNITNTHVPEKVSVSGSKTWRDANNQDGIRPTSITINLLANGVKVDSKTVTEADGWKWNFTNLDKYKAGQEIVYTITEEAVTGYTAQVNGYNVTNTHVPETITISGEKTWNDGNNQDGKRPKSIIISLLADGEVIQREAITEADNWEWSYTNLPKYKAGQEIVYTIAEDAVDGYTTVIDGYNVTNSHTPEIVSVSGTKTWEDEDNQDGIRPSSVIVYLRSNGKPYTQQEVMPDVNGEWKYTFANLPKYENGQVIDYTITESQVAGYTSRIEDIHDPIKEYNLINTHKPAVINVYVEKSWEDNYNQDGIRPDSITLYLYKDATDDNVDNPVNTGIQKVITENEHWKHNFENLPKYEEGVEIKYSVQENAIDDYRAYIHLEDGGTWHIVNTHEVAKTSVSGSKTWSDNNNQDGKRPSSITINLLADGVRVQSRTVTEADDWKWSFTDLDQYKNGREIVYTITENAVADYTAVVNGYNVTNTHKIEKVTVSGSKTWNDADNQDGIRPQSIKIHLYADGTEIASKTVKASDGWAWNFTDLDKYKNGKEIVYTISEEAVTGYTTQVNGYNVTNTHVPEKVTVSGSKTWNDENNQDGKRPQSITINLLADGEKVESKTVTAANGWTWSFADLDKFKAGEEIVYTITEDAVAGYTAEVDGYNVINTHEVEKTEVPITKVWDDANNQDGKRPNSITLQLYADSVEVSGQRVVVTKPNGDNSTWSYVWEDLDKYKDGKEVVYRVREVNDAGIVVKGGEKLGEYTARYERDDTDGTITITNSYTPETIDFPVTKVWNDADDQDGKRPTEIIVQLYADGKAVDGKTLTLSAVNDELVADGDNRWTRSFTGLPKYADGTEIVYTLDEVTVPAGYTKSVAGNVITNNHTPETTTVPITKVWNDANDQDGKRPDSIKLQLYADSTAVDGAYVTLTASDADNSGNWVHEWTNLAKYKDGKEIVYRVREVNASDTVVKNGEQLDAYYTVNYVRDANRGEITITNSHTPETIDIPVTKVWDDNHDQDGKRPNSVTFNLIADGVKVDSKTVSAEDNWEWSFANLAKFKAGKEIDYTITEDAVSEYTTVISGTAATGYTVTNTHTPEKVKVVVNKTWIIPEGETVEVANLPADGAVTVTLLKNNIFLPNNDNPQENEIDGVKAVTFTGKPTDAESITGYREFKEAPIIWTGLDRYQNGKEIIWDVAEQLNSYANQYAFSEKVSHGVDDEGVYTITLDMTNTYDLTHRSLLVNKEWEDNNNQDGIRPVSIDVQLYYSVDEGENWAEVPNNDAPTDHPKENALQSDTVADFFSAVDGLVQLTPSYTRASDLEWGYIWNNLPQYVQHTIQGGTEIIYTVKEVAHTDIVDDQLVTTAGLPDGYYGLVDNQKVFDELEAENTGGWTYKIVNHHDLEKTSITVHKVWNDKDNQDGLRLEEVTVRLYANGESPYDEAPEGYKARYEAVLSADNDPEKNWTHTFTDLPVNYNGQPIKWTVREIYNENYVMSGGTAANDYVVSYKKAEDDLIITNTREPETIDIPVTKVWNDANNQDGIRPISVAVTLHAKVRDDAAQDGFRNLDLTSLGIETGTLLFSQADDENRTDGSNNWTRTFTGLPKYKNMGTADVPDKKEIIYTVAEEIVPEGYVASVEGYTITNTHEVAKTTVTVHKVWEDHDNQDGKRPTSVTVRLYGDEKTPYDTAPEAYKAKYQAVLSANDDPAQNWTYTFTDLPVNYNGKPIKWTVREMYLEDYVLPGGTVADNYVVSYDTAETANGNVHVGDLLIINTRTPETMYIPVTKIWDDNNNQDGKRPLEIAVQLYANGTAVAGETLILSVANDKVLVDGSNQWTNYFTELPKYANGEEIKYTIEEVAVAGYESTTITGTQAEGFRITNKLTPEKVDVSGSKTWSDAENQDGKRPDSIIINLLADGTKVDSKEVTAADGWAWSFTGLDKYKDGKEIAYTITENTVAYYETAVVDGYNVTNTHEIEKVTVSGSKTWNDTDNQDGIRPTSITINLLADGVKVNSKTVTEADGWAYTFTGLDKYKAGKVIVYTVTEDAVAGYTTAINGYDITNTHATEKVDVSIAKVWEDADNQDGKRPNSVTINLLADGVKVDSKEIDAADEWKWSFTGLDKFKAGTPIKYTITEEPVAEYSTTVTGTAVDGYTVTNSYTPQTIDIHGTKTWQDANNQDGKRPNSITVYLWADGKPAGSVQVTADANGNWSYSFENLPKYNKGHEIDYTITEGTEALNKGYVSQIENKNDPVMKYNLINTYKPEVTNLYVEKTWEDNDNQDGKRPNSITVRLLENGLEVDSRVITAADQWRTNFTEIPKYKNGELITYTITEDDIIKDGVKLYQVDIHNHVVGDEGEETFTGTIHIINSYTPETISFTGTKIWDDDNNRDGIRPESITVNLVADGVRVGSKTVTATDNWTYSFENVPKYKDGTMISYEIVEVPAEGYTAEITQLEMIKEVNVVDIKNIHEPETIDISGSKTWNDANNQDGKRPDSITINLLANGTKIDSKTVTAANEWKWSFNNLPKFDAGNEIVYTITENAVEGYTTVIDGYNVTNSYIPEVVNVAGSKIWDDANNQDGKRPASITINLLANGVEIKEVTVTHADSWRWNFANLPKYANGKEIKYTITEDRIASYTSTIDGYNVINTHTPETVQISGTKTWDDNNNQDGKRPESITVYLWANGERCADTTITAASADKDGKWHYSFTNLPKYANGKVIDYTISESDVDGYNSVVTQSGTEYNLVNVYSPEKRNIFVEKSWRDNENQDGKRPQSITVNLLADGVKVDSLTMTADTHWKGNFEDLDKFKDGKEIVYTIEEVAVAGYIVEQHEDIKGTIHIINSHVPETITIHGTKTWDDANNQDGKRPHSVTVHLWANGEYYDSVTVNAQTADLDGKWHYSFTDLPKYANGVVIDYTITEEHVEEYTSQIEDKYDADKKYNLINHYTPGKTNLYVEKTWQDNENQDGKRPNSITVRLLADGVEVDSKIVTANDHWKCNFTDLNEYKDGKKVVYTITEDPVEGYTADIHEKYAGTVHIVNTYTTETIAISGTKHWIDNSNETGVRPDMITVKLFANGDWAFSQDVTSASAWQYSFTNLPKYENGKEIVYTVEETIGAELAAHYNKDAVQYVSNGHGFDIINTLAQKTFNIEGTKYWADADGETIAAPESQQVEIKLFRDNVIVDTTTASALTDWQFSFIDLPRFALDGSPNAEGYAHVYEYRIEETPINGYTPSYAVDVLTNGDVVVDITNTADDEQVVSISGTKIWQDNNNALNLRADSITVVLLADGVEVDTAEVSADTEWKYSFTGLPRYNDEGEAIKYTVAEKDVPKGYISAVKADSNGFDIINTLYSADAGTIVVSKTVEGDNAPAKDVAFDFNLKVKATTTKWDAMLVYKKLLLDEAWEEAVEERDQAKADVADAERIFKNRADEIITSSAYRFIMAKEVEVPSGSAYDFVFGFKAINKYGNVVTTGTTGTSYDFMWKGSEVQQPTGFVQKVMDAIKALAEQFSSLGSESAFLKALYHEVTTPSALGYSSTPSAIGFYKDDAERLFDAQRDLLEAEALVQATTEAALKFVEENATTPSAIKLILTPVGANTALAPLEFDLDQSNAQADGYYEVPFRLFADTGYSVRIEATTGAEISYEIEEILTADTSKDYEGTEIYVDGAMVSSNALTTGTQALNGADAVRFHNMYEDEPYVPPYVPPYIPEDDPEEPKPDPEEPKEDPKEEPEDPIIEPGTVIPNEPVDTPEDAVPTGDTNHPLPYVAMMFIGFFGMLFTRKKTTK